jgi:hypothetical protein
MMTSEISRHCSKVIEVGVTTWCGLYLEAPEGEADGSGEGRLENSTIESMSTDKTQVVQDLDQGAQRRVYLRQRCPREEL